MLPETSKRKSKSKQSTPREIIKLTTFSGEFVHQNIDSIEFTDVVKEDKEKMNMVYQKEISI